MASGTLLAHIHWLVVFLCGADVPVAEENRHEGAVVQPGDMFVEEKSHHVAARGDPQQTVFVIHRLR